MGKERRENWLVGVGRGRRAIVAFALILSVLSPNVKLKTEGGRFFSPVFSGILRLGIYCFSFESLPSPCFIGQSIINIERFLGLWRVL